VTLPTQDIGLNEHSYFCNAVNLIKNSSTLPSVTWEENGLEWWLRQLLPVVPEAACAWYAAGTMLACVSEGRQKMP